MFTEACEKMYSVPKTEKYPPSDSSHPLLGLQSALQDNEAGEVRKWVHLPQGHPTAQPDTQPRCPAPREDSDIVIRVSFFQGFIDKHHGDARPEDTV